MANRSRSYVHRRGAQKNRITFLSLAVVVAALVGILSARCYGMYLTNQTYAAELAALEEEQEVLEAEQEELEAYAEYVGTDDYVIEVARDKLGLVFPGEIIFRAAD